MPHPYRKSMIRREKRKAKGIGAHTIGFDRTETYIGNRRVYGDFRNAEGHGVMEPGMDFTPGEEDHVQYRHKHIKDGRDKPVRVQVSNKSASYNNTRYKDGASKRKHGAPGEPSRKLIS